LKFSEKEIQTYIWDNKAKWSELLLPLETVHEFKYETEEAIINIKPEEILYNIGTRKLKEYHEKIKYLELIGIEVGLEKKGDSTIRADFLGAKDGAPGLAIIELKKSSQTEREAFTELLAYSSHLNSLFPTSCIDDNILILIAPFKVRTVREAYLQTLIFDRKKIIALTPELIDENDISSLKLKPFIPNFDDFARVTNVAFAKRNFDVEVTVWYDTPEFWNVPQVNKNPTEEVNKNMNRVSSFCAQLMEAKKIHGFTYTQQSWPELNFPLPNSLVVVGFNPFKIANDTKYKSENPNINFNDIPEINDSIGYSLADFIPGLNKNAELIHTQENYFYWQNILWGSHLALLGREVLNLMNLNSCNISVYKEGGGMTWEQYEVNSVENIFCHNFDVKSTGVIRELYQELMKIDYSYWNKYGSHPVLYDIYGWAVESFASHSIFSRFLERMFGDSIEF